MRFLDVALPQLRVARRASGGIRQCRLERCRVGGAHHGSLRVVGTAHPTEIVSDSLSVNREFFLCPFHGMTSPTKVGEREALALGRV